MLFLYGTLLSPTALARRGGTPGLQATTQAALAGWSRVGIAGLRWPTLRRARNAVVPGAVVQVPARAFGRLAAWEGPAYTLRRVVVATPSGKTAAWCWIAPGATRRPWRG